MFNSSDITLRVHIHQASMNVGFFSQRSSSLLNNLLPEVKEGMDESGYDTRFFIRIPLHKTKTITCDRSKRQPKFQL